MSTWTFLTNHAHVLLLLRQDADLRIRDMAHRIGITERAVQRILRDLASEGYLEVEKEGRRNHYTIHPDRPMRHAVEAHASVADLLTLANP
jgi:predicted ArsR family transcriptional regulator